MTHQEKLAFIRAKCILSNPEIVELKFGCKIACEQSEQHSVVTVYDSFVECENGIDYSSYEYKIIGRPITLADILLALKMRSNYGYIATNGEMFQSGRDIEDGIAGAKWNLLKTLEDQDEPTISFIYNALK